MLALLSAPLAANWLALLPPLLTSHPAMLTGTLALTAFCSAFACEAASWPVSEPWVEFWYCPPPPHEPQPEPDPIWLWLLFCVVLALLLA
ncbi:MAG: hypothetical protein JO372_12310, partial [Solirubrobacterales bacterium]|nr:hypothetical protein [Solirubrobacterales bacterium]